MADLLTVGIDPGRTGAIAAITADGQLAWIADMPTLTGHALGQEIRDLLDGTVGHVIIERVHAMPKQGVTSVWTFAEGYGAILGAVGAVGVPLTTVTPAGWKKALGLNADKNASRQRASEMWPTMADQFRRVKDDGRAEAALIGWYGWRERTRK